MLKTSGQRWGLLFGAAIAIVAAQPAQAELTQVVAVEFQPGDGEFQIILTTTGSDHPPQVLTREQGNSLIADMPESQLQVAGNSTGFETQHPIPGITTVKLIPTSTDSLSLIVMGEDGLPTGQIRRRTAEQIIFRFTPAPPPLSLSAAIDIPAYPEPLGASAQIRQTFQLNQAIAPRVVAEFTERGASAPGHASVPEAATLPLQGLEVTADNQANTVSLVGEAAQVYAAAHWIKRVDVRLPLVAVNVKVMAVDSQTFERVEVCPLGRFNTPPPLGWPSVIDLSQPESASPDSLDETSSCAFYDPGDFIAHLQAAIENDNAEILSDATLLAQSGQTATVQITPEIMRNLEGEQNIAERDTSTHINPEKVGLSLAINANFKQNNEGRMTLTVEPTVFSSTFTADNEGQFEQRQLSSGQIQIRDQQTLILTGILQSQETLFIEESPDVLQETSPSRSQSGQGSDPEQTGEVILLITPYSIERP